MAEQTLTVRLLSTIIEPVDGLQSKGGTLAVTGIASAPAGINYVEVSIDNGQNWRVATGTTRWSYSWEDPEDGDYTLLSRIIDQDGNIEQPGPEHSVTINSNLPTTSGTLNKDENWSGEIVLTGDVTVPEHVSLNISAGTSITFQSLSDDQSSGSDTSRSELIIRGNLVGAGTAAMPILLTSSSPTPAKNNWVGIRVLSRGSLNLAYTTIEYAANGIDYTLSSGMGEMSVTNCLLRHLSGIGIKTNVANANTVFNGIFLGNEIVETNGNGMYLYTQTNARSELEVVGNRIHHVNEYGIHIYGNNYAQTNANIENNELYGTSTGLYFYNLTYSTSSELNIVGNRIHDNTTGVYGYFSNRGTAYPVFKNNHIYDNTTFGIRLYLSYNYSDIATNLYNNTISGNSTGVHIDRNYSGSMIPELIFNTITGNSNNGVLMKDTKNAVILHNTVRDNGGTGIDLISIGSASVHYNNLDNVHVYELYNRYSAAVDARYNWWGNRATTQMGAGGNPKNIDRIYDIFDDGTKGSVDYSEWLSSAQTPAVEPVSRIIEPVEGLQSKGGTITITGIASAPAGVDHVDVSVDNGQNWQIAVGKTRWAYSWENPADGGYTVVSRVIDLDGNIESSRAGHVITIDSAMPTTSGTLDGDENWSGEVVLTGDVTVPENVTLNIAPGSTLRFQALSDDQSTGADGSRSELIIRGDLIAAGTVSGPITFTSSSLSPVKNDWVGLRVLGGGSINLEHVTIEYAANGIDYSLNSGMGEMVVTNCLIRQLSGIGIKTAVANANTVFNTVHLSAMRLPRPMATACISTPIQMAGQRLR